MAVWFFVRAANQVNFFSIDVGQWRFVQDVQGTGYANGFSFSSENQHVVAVWLFTRHYWIEYYPYPQLFSHVHVEHRFLWTEADLLVPISITQNILISSVMAFENPEYLLLRVILIPQQEWLRAKVDCGVSGRKTWADLHPIPRRPLEVVYACTSNVRSSFSINSSIIVTTSTVILQSNRK